ncbi:hypothetical protein UlMin_014913 [Ulmus minor]
MSNPRVTITLGRSGQVVERGGSEFSRGYGGRVSGGKRSMGDRLGAGGNGYVSSDNKRQRGDDVKLSRNDLRLKLIRKSQSKQSRDDFEEKRGRDFDAKQSNNFQPPTSHHMPQYKAQTNGSIPFRRIPPRESADDLLLVDSLRNSFSSRTTNGLRTRSPDRIFRTPMGLSPPRNFDERWKVPSVREADTLRQFPSSGAVTTSRATGPMPITMKAPEAASSVSQFGPSSGSIQQSLHMETRTVAGLLHALGLGKYAILFQAEEVDMTALRQMGDKDLKDLGLPMGPRKKILLALLATRPKRQPP